MNTLKTSAIAGVAALAIAAFTLPAEAFRGGHMGGHIGMGGFGHSHFAGGFGHGFRGHRGRGFVGFYPYYGGYDSYYDDSYDDDSSYCYWRHGRRFCRY